MTYDLIQIDEVDTEYGVVVTKRGQAFQFERPRAATRE